MAGVEVSIARDAGAWERLFLMSIAAGLRCDTREAHESAVSANGRAGEVVLGGRTAAVRGWVEWSGAWDVDPALVPPRRRPGGWIVVIDGADRSERLETLLIEAAAAARLRGNGMRVVALGQPVRGNRAVDHQLSGVDAGDVLRLMSVATAVLLPENSETLLAPLASRGGVFRIGIGMGARGDRVLSSWGSQDLLDLLESPEAAVRDESGFAPDLIRALTESASS